jgi:hypothetical protein
MRLAGSGGREGLEVLAISRLALRCIPALLLLAATTACARDLPGRGAAGLDQGWVELDTAGESSIAESRDLDVGWRTIAEQTQASRSTLPVEFGTTSDVLRVITRLGTLESPTEPGLVLANVLSGSGAVPVASIRAEQVRRDTTTVDTVEVKVDPGPLQLYVVEAHGVTEWSIKVQAPLSAPLSLPTRR